MLIWTASITAGVVALAAVAVFMVYRHLNGNIQQRDVSGLLGSQPVDLHPQAENILVIGSDTRFGQGKGYGSGLVTDQSDTTMIVHIAANRQWAEVMSIPRDSYVSIPACTMGNGQMSSPQTLQDQRGLRHRQPGRQPHRAGRGLHDENRRAGHRHLPRPFRGGQLHRFPEHGERAGRRGGVQHDQPINDPKSHLQLTAGKHLLNPKQALAYVRARYTLGDGSDLERIGRQQAFMSSLIQRVKSKLLNPVAIYRFLDAATKSLTIDTKLGGATGLYNLASSLRSLPSNKVAFFTLPTYPRSEVDPADTANVLWTQPEDSKIFQTFRDDVPASQSLFVSPSASPSASAPASGAATSSASSTPSVTPSATPDTAPSGSTGAGRGAASGSASPGASVTPSLPIPSARTANQNICTG